MRFTSALLPALVLGFLVSACDGGTASATDPAPGAVVQVAADGTRFDPAVPVAQLPKGAWYCDMGGTAHYATMTKAEKCPVCGMRLETNQPSLSATPDGHDHAGHDHAGHEH